MHAKSLALYGASIILIASAFLWWFQRESESPEPQVYMQSVASDLQPEQTSEAAGLEETTRDAEHLTSESRLFTSMRERFRSPPHDPMILGFDFVFTEAEIAAYNRLHIVPFNTVIDETCHYETSHEHPGEAKVCNWVRQFPEHPYASLTDDELESMSGSDGVAALFLGDRTKNELQRTTLYLQATALSEKVGTILELSEKHYSSDPVGMGVDGRGREDINVDYPQDAVRTASAKYVLETLAARLGDPRARPERWENYLNAALKEEAPSTTKKLDAQTTSMLQFMATVQREVTGSTQIQEMLDI